MLLGCIKVFCDIFCYMINRTSFQEVVLMYIQIPCIVIDSTKNKLFTKTKRTQIKIKCQVQRFVVVKSRRKKCQEDIKLKIIR